MTQNTFLTQNARKLPLALTHIVSRPTLTQMSQVNYDKNVPKPHLTQNGNKKNLTQNVPKINYDENA